MSMSDFRVASAVSNLAEKHSLTLKALAEKLALPYRTVQNYLSGDVRIPADFIAKCCNLFAVEADFLLFWGIDVDRTAFNEAVFDALKPVLPGLEVQKGRIGLRKSGTNEFASSDAEESYARAIMLHIAPMIRDGYTDRRNLALRNEGRSGVYPTDEASKINTLHGPFEKLP